MLPKKKLVIGIGKTGQSCINFFEKNNIEYKVFDTRNNLAENCMSEGNKTESLYRFKNFEKEFLDDIEEVVISPGLSLNHEIINEVRKLSIPIITDIELWHRYSNIPIIAISGTNGKTTVVDMLEHLLNHLDLKSLACGNNGVPILKSLNDCDYKYLVLELSSYQLEYTKNIRAFISLITNVEDDHLERHQNYKNYLSIKKKIFLDCKHSVCNISLSKEMLDIKGHKLYGFDDKLKKIFINGKINNNLNFDDNKISYKNTSIRFRGIHNLDNLLAVLSISEILNINMDNAFPILASYKYPLHRIQFIKEHNNVTWYNDSKSTNVSSTIAAIKFVKKNILLILGGSEKLLDYSKLNSYIEESVKLIIFLGENKKMIRKKLITKKPMIDVKSIRDAVLVAHKNSSSGDSVLLSPASPSFDMFSNYEERGEEFIKAVNDITK